MALPTELIMRQSCLPIVLFTSAAMLVPPVRAQLEPAPTFTTPQAVGIQYDIVACRMPLPSTLPADYRDWFPDVFNFSIFVGPGSDLVAIHPDGTETVLVSAGSVPIQSVPGGVTRTSANASIVDPLVSFDAKSIYFALFEDPIARHFQRKLPIKPAFIFRYSLTTGAVTQLTFDDQVDVSDQFRQVAPPYAKLDVAPVELADGRILFLSNRANVMEPGNEKPAMRFYRMHGDGSNVEPVENFTLGSCQHPIILRDGRIAWTHHHPVGRRNINGNFPLLVANPDMSDIKTMAGDHYYNTAFHFISQLSNGDFVSNSYYQQNNFGHGMIVRFPLVSGQGFNPVSDIASSSAHFERVSQTTAVPWPLGNLNDDHAARLRGGSQTERVGKVTMPSGAPGGDMLMVWSPGPVNNLNRPVSGFPHMHVAYAPGGSTPTWSAMSILKWSASYHYMYPKAVVPYAAIHGVAKPTLIPDTTNSGSIAALPAGSAFATTGTSSVYNRESRWPNPYDDAVDPNIVNNLLYSSTLFVVGQDTIRFPNSRIHAAQVVADMSHVFGNNSWYQPLAGRYRSHNNGTQVWGILGEIPLRKFAPNGSPILDAQGNPDTSYEVRIPADVPFHNRVIDVDGITLTSETTWHSARPGERKNNCGGCHAHSINTQPLDFGTTAAGQAGYTVTDFALQTPVVSRDPQNQPSVLIKPGRAWVVEYWQDVQPILTARCVGCHNSPASLDLRANASPPPWDSLAFTNTSGYPILYGAHQPTKYVRKNAASQSLLVWKAYGSRLDGRSDGNGRPGDIPFGPAHAPTITFDEKRTIAAWVDLGCQVDVNPASADESDPFDDQMKPSLAISGITRGKVTTAPTSITVSGYDLHSGIAPASLEIRIGSWTATNLAAGTTISNGSVHTIPLPALATGQLHKIHVRVADVAGNRSREILDVMVLSPAALVTVGSGSPGTAGQVPTLSGSTLPRVGEQAFELVVANTVPNTPTIIWSSAALANPPFQLLPNAFVYLSSLDTFSFGVTDSTGNYRAGLPIPNDPGLNGVTLYFQSLVFDPGGQQLIPGVTGALTPGLALTVGG